MQDEIVFLVRPDETGGYCAKAVGLGIFTQAETLDELTVMIRDAIAGYYFDAAEKPDSFTLKFERIPIAVE